MQKEAKEKIQKLIEKYEKAKNSGILKSYSEEETKKDFILPLFEALGWNTSEKKEVSAEEHIESSGRVDYGFYLNDRVKFYLEAKKISADLFKEDYAHQAVRYSFNKGVVWAVLTDFENLIVFNAQEIDKSLADKKLFDISCSQYLERFEQLQLLSRESFENDLIDKYAEEHGKKLQKVPISSLLYKDLQECRDILTNELGQWNSSVDSDTLDEGVQKLLDRLIFIRVAEDRKVEEAILIPMVRQARKESGGHLYQSMIKKFREFDETYNSNLFKKHTFEKWKDHSGATEKAINKLYGKPGYYEYDFKAMSPDVLGAVYESYLSHRLSQSKKGITVSENAKKRKEQGIYYTPPFIVDYIVKNALGPVLDKCKSIRDMQKIKVLDPACGSGSFLIRALDLIYEKYLNLGSEKDKFSEMLIKIQILKNNIYGVDLDPQAIEITRLNLLINSLTEKQKLPFLDNIKNGNSLISGTDEELKKYFGKNFRDKKPFNWKEEFPEVFAQGGFDVIIGNPPYGAEISSEEAKFFKDKYNIGSTDTAILFIKKSLTEIKKEGFLGFIVPKAFCFASNYGKIRDLVWDSLNTIIDCSKVWHEVKLEQIIIILQKDINCEIYKSGIAKDNNIIIGESIKKQIAKSFGFFPNGLSEKEIKVGLKIFQNGTFLGNFIKNKRGVILNKFIEHGKYPVIGCKEIDRYKIKNVRGYIDENLFETAAEINKDSVLVQGIVAHIENPVDHIKITANIPDSIKYFIADNINQITPNKEFSKYFIWALLNSVLINWYCYRFIYGKSIRTMRFDNPITDRIPIPKIISKKQEVIVNLSKELLRLHKDLQKADEDSDKWNSVKSEIEKTDKKIDQEVYKLYDLTQEEINIVKNF